MCFSGLATLQPISVIQKCCRNSKIRETASLESGAGEQSSYRRSVGGKKENSERSRHQSLSKNFLVEKNTLSPVCQTENVRVCALESFKRCQINNRPSVSDNPTDFWMEATGLQVAFPWRRPLWRHLFVAKCKSPKKAASHTSPERNINIKFL